MLNCRDYEESEEISLYLLENNTECADIENKQSEIIINKESHDKQQKRDDSERSGKTDTIVLNLKENRHCA